MLFNRFVDYENPNSLVWKIRARRLKPLIDLITHVNESKGSVNILDVGGRAKYWGLVPRQFLEAHNVLITVVNLPEDLQSSDDGMFKVVTGNACNMEEFDDNQFDIVHSNSVIEHVGSWENILAYAREVDRLAPYIFIQTPNFWFPIEPHFMRFAHHWLPRPLRVRASLKSAIGQRGRAVSMDQAHRMVEEEPFLLDKKSFAYLFPNCTIIPERLLLLTKSFVAFRGVDHSHP